MFIQRIVLCLIFVRHNVFQVAYSKQYEIKTYVGGQYHFHLYIHHTFSSPLSGAVYAE